jgi:putative addiction module killer protein
MNTIEKTNIFEDWFCGLRDKTVKARIQVRIDRAEDGNFGDCKAVGDGVSEMRLHFGSGYRLYYTQIGATVYLLLIGGDKATQNQDIEQAIAMAQQLREDTKE